MFSLAKIRDESEGSNAANGFALKVAYPATAASEREKNTSSVESEDAYGSRTKSCSLGRFTGRKLGGAVSESSIPPARREEEATILQNDGVVVVNNLGSLKDELTDSVPELVCIHYPELLLLVHLLFIIWKLKREVLLLKQLPS